MTEAKKDPVPVFVIKRLGTQVPQFDLPVNIQKLDGTPARIILRCNALKKTVWAAIKDGRQREAIEATLAVGAPADAQVSAQPGAKKAAEKRKEKTDDAAAPADRAEMREVVLKSLAENGFEAAVGKALKADAEVILKFAIGWELEDEFTAENMSALEDEFAGSMEAAMNAYDRAIFRGQVGNSKP